MNAEDRDRMIELTTEIVREINRNDREPNRGDIVAAARSIMATAEPSAFDSAPVQLRVHLDPLDPSKDCVRLPDGRRVKFVTKIHATSKVKEGRVVKIEFVPDRIELLPK